MSELIGVGIITCNRPEFFKKCRKSINDEWYDPIVVVNDGNGPIFDARSPVLKTTGGEGVGKAKNKAIEHLLEAGCDYIILVEDDMLFKNNSEAFHVPPVETRTWFHTGVYFDEDKPTSGGTLFDHHKLIETYKKEFYAKDTDAFDIGDHVFAAPENSPPTETTHEIFRARRGAVLRPEG